MSDGPEMRREKTQESSFQRALGLFFSPLWVMPVLVIGGLVVASYAPGPIESFYTDTALPFLLSCWIGLGFTYVWRHVRESMLRDDSPPGVAAGVGILSALILLSMLGGIGLLWEDPWLFGVAVAPGFAMARPLLQRWMPGRPQVPQTSAGSRTDGSD
jgi:hypothetical protein